jgi:hypothetical protein
MGFFGRAKDAQKQLKDAIAAAGGVSAPAAGVKAGASGANVEEMLRYRELGQKLAASGIEAPAVINTITPGEEQMGGSVSTVFEVTIAPADGDPYAATITQSFLQTALNDLSVGEAITVRYDPDDRASALIYSW